QGAQPRQEGGREEIRGKAEVGQRRGGQQGRRAGDSDGQNLSGEASAQNRRQEERRQGKRISGKTARQGFSRAGRPRRLHPRASRKSGDPRNRAGIWPEERRPRRAETHIAAT